ncbi:MAG: hypothetical protein ACP5F3_00235 [Candidatus Syntrophosphaera sp.]
MSILNIRRLLPVIPIAWELFRHVRRDISHNKEISKHDNKEEQLATIENLVVKLEKKAIANREELRKSSQLIQIWLAINSALLIAIAVKLFFF